MKSPIWKRLLGFTALGACALVVTLWWQSNNRQYDPIRISMDQLQLAEASWRDRWGRPPDQRDREIILRNETNEEVLFREALRAGLHRTDPVVKRRLWQNMQFLELEEPVESGMALLERAYELGMHTSDIVVRRRLVQRFHRNLLDAASPREPSREELIAFINEDPNAFHAIPRLSFVQVYLGGEDEEAVQERARTLLLQLQREQRDPAASSALGDPLPLQREFVDVTPVDLSKRLGHVFTAALTVAPVGAWSGPHASSLGWHLVWLSEYRPAEVILDDVTLAKARSRLIDRRKEAMVRSALAALRQRYEIIVEAPAIDNAQRES